MLSYMKWAVNLTKSSLLRSACPSCSWDGTLAGGGKHPLLPCQSSRPTQTSKYSKKNQVRCLSHIRNSAITLHSRPTYRHQFLGCDCHPTAGEEWAQPLQLPSLNPFIRTPKKGCMDRTRRQLKSKTRRCLQVTDIEKDRICKFLTSNQKEHRVVLHRRQRCDSTARAPCGSCPGCHTWHWGFQPSSNDWE